VVRNVKDEKVFIILQVLETLKHPYINGSNKCIETSYIHSALLHVSANHVAIFREVKYEVRHIEIINNSVLVHIFDVSKLCILPP
jgi:hypothetical protein